MPYGAVGMHWGACGALSPRHFELGHQRRSFLARSTLCSQFERPCHTGSNCSSLCHWGSLLSAYHLHSVSHTRSNDDVTLLILPTSYGRGETSYDNLTADGSSGRKAATHKAFASLQRLMRGVDGKVAEHKIMRVCCSGRLLFNHNWNRRL
jgi:hypothetical protein